MSRFHHTHTLESEYATLLNTMSAEVTSAGAEVTSVGAEVTSIVDHHHGWEVTFYKAGTPTGTHKAVAIGTGATLADYGGPFQLDGADSQVNETWGTAVQIFGSDDTPTDGSATIFDFHRIGIVDAERASGYMIQLIFGVSSAAGLSAGTYTTFHVGISTANKVTSPPTEVLSNRNAAGTEVWARCIALGQNTGTIDFFPIIHEYLV